MDNVNIKKNMNRFLSAEINYHLFREVNCPPRAKLEQKV